MVLCDVRNRWESLNGKPSLFTTGTDEHGLKVQAAAEKKNLPPQKFVDSLSTTFKELAAIANVKYDRFIRTTDNDHSVVVTQFWNTVKQNGFIYEGDHNGWYSVSDETFYPETQIHKIKDKNGAEKMVSIETGSEVVFQSEKNYFFKLSAFYEPLLKLLKDNPNFIIPQSKQKSLIKELESQSQLEDLSISRPSSRLKWGIPVPGDSSQSIYVWFDALVNYVTSALDQETKLTGKPSKFPTSEFNNRFWPPTHLIGKDIIKFHAVFWPCFLMAAKIAPPKQIIVHGHWLCEGVKMSKSLGNVVDPVEMINVYGADSLRLFLCENSVFEGDGDFSEKQLYYSRNNVIGKLANLIMRCCGPKFNILRAANKYQIHELDDVAQSFSPELRREYLDLIKEVNSCAYKVGKHIESFEMVKATEVIWSMITKANGLVQLGEPWRLSNESQKDAIIFAAIDAARVGSILFSAIMPELSKNFLDRMGVAEDRRSVEYAKFGVDVYGEGVNRKGDAPMEKIEYKGEK